MFNFVQIHPCPGLEVASCYLVSDTVIYVVLFRIDGTVSSEVF